MSTIRANSITNSAGSGAPDFPNGLTDNSNAVLNSASSLPAANLTGTLPALNASSLTNLPAANLTGTLPAIDGSALTNLPAPTSNQVGTATAGLAVDSVGSYALLYQTTTNTARAPGATVAGSTLRFTSCAGVPQSVAASGTWRIMGALPSTTAAANSTSLWLRIS